MNTHTRAPAAPPLPVFPRTRTRSAQRALERAVIIGFVAGSALTTIAWWALARLLEVAA